MEIVNVTWEICSSEIFLECFVYRKTLVKYETILHLKNCQQFVQYALKNNSNKIYSKQRSLLFSQKLTTPPGSKLNKKSSKLNCVHNNYTTNDFFFFFLSLKNQIGKIILREFGFLNCPFFVFYVCTVFSVYCFVQKTTK